MCNPGMLTSKTRHLLLVQVKQEADYSNLRDDGSISHRKYQNVFAV